MVKHRNLVSFLITTSFYLLLAGVYFYLQKRSILSDQQPRERVVHLSLANYVPATPPAEELEEEKPVEESVEPEPEPEPEPVVEEKPLPKQAVPEPVKPKPLPKKEKKPEPRKKPEPKKKKKPKKKHVKKRVKRHLSAKSTQGNPRRGVSRQNSANKNRFLSMIRQKINRHKSYPKIARRRGMQGVVKVRFTILANGRVGNISVNGPKVFHRSARKAIENAFPVNTKSVPVSLPKTVSLTLRYQLR